jgi:hypothetical protein
MCPLENQSSAKDLQQSLVQKSNEYKLAFILKSHAKIFNREESIQEKSEKEKKISFTSIHHFSSLYFHIIQNL